MIAAISTFSWLSDQIPLFVVVLLLIIRTESESPFRFFFQQILILWIFFTRGWPPRLDVAVVGWVESELELTEREILRQPEASPGRLVLLADTIFPKLRPVYLSVFSSWQSCGNCWPMLFLPSHSDSQKIEVIETLVLLDWKKIDLLGHNLTDSLGPPDQPVPS